MTLHHLRSFLAFTDARNPFRIAAALLLAAAGSWVYSPAPSAPFAFEVRMTSSRRAHVQVYFDLGRGLNEADSSSQLIYADGRRWTVRLALPSGTCRALRFDPVDNDATVEFTRARILNSRGQVVRAIAPADWQPNDQAGALSLRGAVATMKPLPGCDDPNLTLRLPSPLVLHAAPRHRLRDLAPGFLIGAAAVWVMATLAAAAWGRRAAWEPAVRRRPLTAVWAIAAGSALLATYPVVFFGRSFVSPNAGAALLYENAPTVPGYSDLRQENPGGADIGSMMWEGIPYGVLESAALRHGAWPLWNRFNACGVTLLGQGQSMMGDPLHAIVLLAGGASWAWDVKFVLARVLFAAGIGVCVWTITRRLGAAGLAAATAPFIAFFAFRVNHPAIFSVCYSPWILAAWTLLVRILGDPPDRSGRPRLAAGIALGLLANTAEFASGTVKEAYLLMLVLNGVGFAAWLLTPARDPAEKRRTALLLAAFGVAWLLALTALWLPFVETLKTAFTAYDVPRADLAPRPYLLGFFDDLYFRELSPARNPYLPATNAVVLLGVLAALVQPNRLRRAPWALACLAGMVAPLLFAFGFVPRAWILALPLVRNFYSIHNFFSAAALVPACVLAGWGFATGRERMRERGAGWTVAAAAVLLVALGAYYFGGTRPAWSAGAGWAGWRREAPSHAFFYANVAITLLGLAFLVFQTSGAAWRRRLNGPGATAFVLVFLLWRQGTHLPAGRPLPWLVAPAVRENLAAPSPAVRFMQRDGAGAPFRAAGMDNDLFSGFAGVYGLEGVNGPEALMNARYRQLAETAGLVRPGDWRFILDVATVISHRRLLDLFGVRYLATSRERLPPGSGYRLAGSFDLDVYASATAWPRAFFTDRLGRYDTVADLAEMIRGGDGRPFAAVQDEDSDLPRNYASHLESRAVVPATGYRLEPNATSFEVRSTGPGVVVLNETWREGDFRAFLDGRPVPYLRVNQAFKAVQIDSAGVHRITFEYWPRHYALALSLSAFFSLALFGGLIRLASSGSGNRLVFG